jgi:hypothetical protein
MKEKSEKRFFVPLLVMVIGGIAVALFVWWLNSEKYDLRYTLSENIPLRFGGAPEEAIQQIEVKNLSKGPVEKIQVKFPPILTTFEVSKFSQADNVAHFKNEDSEEFDYPILPPQGSFSIIFKTPGTGVTRYEVHVSHSKGKATYALETGQSTLAMAFLGYVCGFLFWAAVSLLSIRSTFIDSLNFKAEYGSEWVLKKGIPFFISHEKWAEIRDKAVRNLPKYQYEISIKDIEDSESYKWLDREKPEYLSDEEWDKVRRVSVERLRAVIDNRVRGLWVSENEVLKYIRVKMPTQYGSDKWEELLAELQKIFLSKRASPRFDEDLVAKLQEAKPDCIGQTQWTENQTILAERMAAKLYDRALQQDSPLTYIKGQNLNVLPRDVAKKILEDTYRVELKQIPNLIIEDNAKAFLGNGKPAWMVDEDYLRFKQTAERALQVAKTEVLNDLLKCILWNSPLRKKDLELLETELQERLIKMDGEIRLAKEKNQSEIERISNESQQLARDKKAILKQLNVLDNLFKDPSSVGRIEPYDNPFTTGNFELLKKVSTALQERGKV